MIPIYCFGPRLGLIFKVASRSFASSRLAALAIGMITSVVAIAPAPAQIHRLHSDEMSLFQRVSSNAGQQRKTMKLDPILCMVARQRAADMARRNYFGHVNPDGQGANYLVRRAGFVLPAYYDSSRSGNNIESLGMSAGSAQTMVALWLKSPAHRLHVLGELDFYQQQTSVGVGIVRSPRPPYYKYNVFLSAPPSASFVPGTIILKNSRGEVISSTRKFATAWARLTGTAAP